MKDDVQTAKTHSVDEPTLRVYEVGYHIIPTVPEANLEGVVASLHSLIETVKGSFIAEGAPVSTKLAYTMSAREGDKNVNYDRGFFGWIKFEAGAESVALLDESLKANPQILRFITFRTLREETRAQIKAPTLREVRRTDTIKSAPRHVEDTSVPVSEVELEKALDVLTTD